MNKIKKFNSFTNESNVFDWKIYGEKRELVMKTLPELIEKIRPLSDFGKRIFHEMAYNDFGNSYIREIMNKHGFNSQMMYEIYNNINTINTYIGPNLSGEFTKVKLSLLDRIMGKSNIRVVKGTSIIDCLIQLVPEFSEEMTKNENDRLINKMVDEIWKIHPNNPKNKINTNTENTDNKENIERKVKLMSDFVKINNPLNDLKENRNDWYDEEEWEWRGEKRISKRPNEKYIIEKSKNYKQMMINLSNMVLKYKQEVIELLEPKMEFLDKKVYNKLLKRIDDLYNYINGDSSHIKGEKTRLQYSIVELLDKFINKDNTNYKLFF